MTVLALAWQRLRIVVAIAALSIPFARGVVAAQASQAVPDSIDWNRARAIHQRQQHGEALSPDDQAYLEQARQALQRAGRCRFDSMAMKAARTDGLPTLPGIRGNAPFSYHDPDVGSAGSQ